MFFWEMSSWLEYEVVFWDILRYFEMVIPGTSEWQKKVVIRRVELGIGAPEFLGPRQWWKVTGARGFPTGRGVLGRTVIWIIHEVWGIPFYPIISHYIPLYWTVIWGIPFYPIHIHAIFFLTCTVSPFICTTDSVHVGPIVQNPQVTVLRSVSHKKYCINVRGGV